MKVDQLIEKLQDLRNKWGNLDVYCNTVRDDVSRPVSVSVDGSLPDYACINIKLE